MQKLLLLPTQILLSARYLSLPHLCLLCGCEWWHAFAARICLITTVGLGCLSKLTCQSSCQIFSFILGHVSQPPQQRNKWEQGSSLFQTLLSVGVSFTQLWLAGSCCSMSQSTEDEDLKVCHSKTLVYYLSFLLMLCASMLTVNSHLKQPSATELSARDVSEPHGPFKILHRLKGHQSARRDPYLWVRSLRDIHSITFFFPFFTTSLPPQCYYTGKTERKKNQVTVCKTKGEYWSFSWRVCTEPITFVTWMPVPACKPANGACSSWSLFKGYILLSRDIFNAVNTVHLCSKPSAGVHMRSPGVRDS